MLRSQQLKNIFIKGTVEELAKIREVLYKLPSNILKLLNEKGFTIKIDQALTKKRASSKTLRIQPIYPIWTSSI